MISKIRINLFRLGEMPTMYIMFINLFFSIGIPLVLADLGM